MKKYRILYNFYHSKFPGMGFQNSTTLVALNVDEAVKEAKKRVEEVYGSEQMKHFSFKPDPVYSGSKI